MNLLIQKLEYSHHLLLLVGISNTIDKICRGYVVEFIDFKFLPVLNIADFFMAIGWIAFLITFIFFAIREFGSNKKRAQLKDDDKEKKS